MREKRKRGPVLYSHDDNTISIMTEMNALATNLGRKRIGKTSHCSLLPSSEDFLSGCSAEELVPGAPLNIKRGRAWERIERTFIQSF